MRSLVTDIHLGVHDLNVRILLILIKVYLESSDRVEQGEFFIFDDFTRWQSFCLACFP